MKEAPKADDRGPRSEEARHSSFFDPKGTADQIGDGGATVNIGQKFSVTILTMLSVTFLPTLSNAQRGPTGVTPHYINTDVRAPLQGLAAVGIDVVIEEGVQVQGTITLVSNVPMTPDEFRTAMIDRLRGLGYRITYEDGVLRIGPMEP